MKGGDGGTVLEDMLLWCTRRLLFGMGRGSLVALLWRDGRMESWLGGWMGGGSLLAWVGKQRGKRRRMGAWDEGMDERVRGRVNETNVRRGNWSGEDCLFGWSLVDFRDFELLA